MNYLLLNFKDVSMSFSSPSILFTDTSSLQRSRSLPLISPLHRQRGMTVIPLLFSYLLPRIVPRNCDHDLFTFWGLQVSSGSTRVTSYIRIQPVTLAAYIAIRNYFLHKDLLSPHLSWLEWRTSWRSLRVPHRDETFLPRTPGAARQKPTFHGQLCLVSHLLNTPPSCSSFCRIELGRILIGLPILIRNICIPKHLLHCKILQ